MSLKELVAAKLAEGDGLPEAQKAVEAACAAGGDVVEVEVPYALAEQLRDWVESEGARCAIVKGMRGKPYLRFAELVINMKLAPRPEFEPEPENN